MLLSRHTPSTYSGYSQAVCLRQEYHVNKPDTTANFVTALQMPYLTDPFARSGSGIFNDTLTTGVTAHVEGGRPGNQNISINIS